MTFNRESVFLSAIRSFCNMLGGILGIFVAITLVVVAISTLSGPNLYPEKSTVTIAPDANGNRKLLATTAPIILRINLKGVIGLDQLTAENFQNILYDSQDTFFDPSRVKGILLQVDTPGGTAIDSAGIYQCLMSYKKKYNVPVFAFVDGLCASGGMYACAAADKIYATPGSVIGSVGVVLGPNFNVSDLMTKIGVQALTITQGKDKDSLNPFRPWKEGEDTSIVNITKQLYEQFVAVVAEGRPDLSKEKLINEYGAQVFLAPTAKTLGYIDAADSDYSQAIAELASAANLGEAEYQVYELNQPKNFLSELAQNKLSLLSGKVQHVIPIGPYMTSELSGKLLYLYQP
jgi:protease IV